MGDLKTASHHPAFGVIPGWAEDDHAAAFRAFLRTCQGPVLDGLPAGPLLRDAACALGPKIGPAAARAFFEEHFRPRDYAASDPPGFVTAYYEPELRGSRTKSARFHVPVYGRPGDLVTTIGESERARYNGTVTGFRRAAAGDVPYHTRAEIEAGALAGRELELLYTDDPVDFYFLQVQGSGLVHLDDGSSVRLTYAGKNGHPYTSIARVLVERHALRREETGMETVKAWLRADTRRGREVMQRNESYVFFRERPIGRAQDGPLGADGAVLTPGRSLAVDPAYIPLGSPVFVTVPNLVGEDGRIFRRLMVAQDVGSAIGGPQRGDLFIGTGETAGAIAGQVRHEARFHVLTPNR
ncbi:MltA domain-containing protein [Methyloceanibacter sp.]|uniref:murein transglycosylase A n=1 Tax=Methyloceanibacter sp. TaxID=1965321 RepID=UPI002C96B894|nr:MltA domain-containing protein [Methyloceanibacter sp.]HML91603.1 MltA domain-containing protein [Methyloceanibacter sp.]